MAEDTAAANAATGEVMRREIEFSRAVLKEATFSDKATSVTLEFHPTDAPAHTWAHTADVPRHPEFTAAINALKPLVERLCEVGHHAKNKITVLSVKMKEENDEPGAVISAKREFRDSDGVLALNTPVRYREHPLARKRFDKADWKLIRQLEDEAIRYVAGKTSQTDMFDAPSGDGAAAGAADVDPDFDDGGAALQKVLDKKGEGAKVPPPGTPSGTPSEDRPEEKPKRQSRRKKGTEPAT